MTIGSANSLPLLGQQLSMTFLCRDPTVATWQALVALRRRATTDSSPSFDTLLLVLVRVRGARLWNERLPDGRSKEKLLMAIDRATDVTTRRRALALVGPTKSRLRTWTNRQGLCTLDDGFGNQQSATDH